MSEDEFEQQVLESLNSLIEKGFVKSEIIDGQICYSLTQFGSEITQLLISPTDTMN